MTEQEQNWRARCLTQGFEAAIAGKSILDNPHVHETPASRWWIDGWCAFHSTDKQPLKPEAKP